LTRGTHVYVTGPVKALVSRESYQFIFRDTSDVVCEERPVEAVNNENAPVSHAVVTQMQVVRWQPRLPDTFVEERFSTISVSERKTTLVDTEDAEDSTTLYRRAGETPGLRPQSVDTESGFWLWEGALDLVHYLSQLGESCWCKQIGVRHGALEILEIGCGHALPAIYLARQGHCVRVDFQDHSCQVLETITQPNVWRNGIWKQLHHEPQFYAGSWQSWLEDASMDRRYDLILASETVYSRASTRLCLQVCRKLLKPHGMALFSGKTVYFGLDGGMVELVDILHEIGGQSHLLWCTSQQIAATRREIRSVAFDIGARPTPANPVCPISAAPSGG